MTGRNYNDILYFTPDEIKQCKRELLKKFPELDSNYHVMKDALIVLDEDIKNIQKTEISLKARYSGMMQDSVDKWLYRLTKDALGMFPKELEIESLS